MKIFSVVVAFQWSKGNFCLLEIEENQDIIRYDDINYLYLHYVLGLKRLLVAMISYAKLTSNSHVFVNRIFGGHYRLCLRSRFERNNLLRNLLRRFVKDLY